MRIRSSSDSGSVIGSLIVTIILWMAMAFCAYFIKPFDMQKEPEYTEIRITLSDFPSLETGEPEIKEIEPEPVPPIETTEPVEPQNTETQAAQSEQMPQPKPVTQTAAEPQPAQPQPVQTQPTVAETTAVPQTVPATTQTQQTQNTTASAPASQSQTSVAQPKPQNTTPVQAQTPAPQQQPKPAVQEQNAQQVDPTPKTEIVQAVDRTPKDATDDTAFVPPVTTSNENSVEQPQTKPVTTENLSTVENNPSKKISWDDFDWDDIEATTSSSNQNPSKIYPVNNNSADALIGSAGEANNNAQLTQTSYTDGGKKNDNSSGDGDFDKRLKDIEDSSNNGNSDGSTPASKNSSNTEIKTSSDDIVWEGGKKRNSYGELKLVLSESSQNKLANSSYKELSISFKVTEAGSVLINSITTEPTLAWAEVITDIQQYIANNWRFEDRDFQSNATIRVKITPSK